MLYRLKILSFSFIIVVAASIILAFTNAGEGNAFKMPYKKAGLTQRQAAAHLIDRFTFGNRPGAIDEVMKMGLEEWFTSQLDGQQNDVALTDRLAEYDALKLSNAQVLAVFPNNGIVTKEAREEAGLNRNDSAAEGDKKLYREQLKVFMEKKGYRPQSELFQQFVAQKILTAAYSNNQLHQLLTEFWFNHFNVSITKNQCAEFVPAYERDVIRPNVTGKFQDLLLATAQSPAMLIFLDNFTSAGENDGFEMQQEKQKKRLEKNLEQAMKDDPTGEKAKQLTLQQNRKKAEGLNENYAREVMELHTLGVDGGYTQQDVTQAARVLTGWTIYPFERGPGGNMKKVIERFGEDNLTQRGFVHKGDFLFAMNRHDNAEKTVLGKIFAAGGGYNEGLELLRLLAHHPSTAKFICTKLAVKFVSDNPPPSLINKMSATFLTKDGDIKEVLKTMVASPEFWSRESLTQKTKSPFELAISAVRSLDAEVKMPFMLYQWITKMGQKIYYYQAPTGFPDRGQYWINTGSLLNRMNFGLSFASQKIPGISFNLAALNNNHEPESAADALAKYSAIILPERNVDATVKRLTPLINDPSLQQKVTEAAGKTSATIDNNQNMTGEEPMAEMKEGRRKNKMMNEDKLAKQQLRMGSSGKEMAMPSVAGNNSMLAQVVGIILGSPEFQKR
jgi:uncharacterized protein (DUF1800 family)